MSAPSSLNALHALQRAFAEEIRGAGADTALPSRIRVDRGIPAAERLSVYTHAWFARLHEALREDYGALAAALGEEAFHDLVKLYLEAHPPRSRSLRFAGAGLADFLRGPVAGLFERRWPFAADLAALEWALVDVFDAPDEPLLERAALLALAPEQWAGLRLVPVAAHRLLSLDWPVDALRTAWSAEGALPAISQAPTCLLVHRFRERVFHRRLDRVEQSAWMRLHAGDDFSALCGAVADLLGADEGMPRWVALVERWIAEGVLVAFDPGSCR